MDLIRRGEACEMLGISKGTLDRLIQTGKLPAYRITDKAVRLAREDVERYLEAARILPPPAPTVRRRKPEPERVCAYYPGMKVV